MPGSQLSPQSSTQDGQGLVSARALCGVGRDKQEGRGSISRAILGFGACPIEDGGLGRILSSF